MDSGIAAILEYWTKKVPEEVDKSDLTTISELLQQVYVAEKWKKNIYSIFLNYPLSQPSYKTEAKKREKLREFLDDLLNGVEPLDKLGDCIACGSRSTRKHKNRQHIPMTGSGGALNFFSFTSQGADYCDTCAFSVQCSPLTYYACGKLAMLHSNSAKVMHYWAKRSLANIQQQITLNDYTGCFNEGYTNPQNALFHITQDLILSYEERWAEENATIRLYHFTNYIQGPDLDIYDLPAPIFRFLAEVQTHARRKDWYGIVHRGYYFTKNGKEIGFSVAGKSEGDYKNSKNRVYLNLLAGRSILSHFLNIQARKAYGDYSLLALYLREILAMDRKRIETVKRVADEIADFIRHSRDGKKRLRNLEESVKFRDFCNVLRRISKGRISLRAQEPLFTLDEFAEQLFPDGALGFGETRYLILFRLYEQLHDWLLAEGLAEDEVDDTVTEISDDNKPTSEE